jgi:hypothetical protein
MERGGALHRIFGCIGLIRVLSCGVGVASDPDPLVGADDVPRMVPPSGENDRWHKTFCSMAGNRYLVVVLPNDGVIAPDLDPVV